MKRARNPAATPEYQRAYRRANPGYVARANARKRAKYIPGDSTKYGRKRRGVPESLYPKPAKCECCGLPRSLLVIDHDHATGDFRGWLCHKCNLAIGGLGDTIHGLQRALDYLRSAECLK